MQYEVGKTYRTRGGWPARVVWRREEGRFHSGRLTVVHKPGQDDESVPIEHLLDGKAVATFAVNLPPTYYDGHPADLTDEEVW